MASIPKIVFYICFSVLLAACKDGIQTIVEESFSDGSPKTVTAHKMISGKKEKTGEVSYYPGGIIRFEGVYRNGQKHGKWVYYYENCNKWSLGFFRNGLSDGKITTWYKDGRKRYEGYFYQGKKTGKWRFWNEAGNLLSVERIK